MRVRRRGRSPWQLDRGELHRARAVRREIGDGRRAVGAALAGRDRVGDDVARRSAGRWPAARPRASIVNRCGRERPRSETVATIVVGVDPDGAVPARDHPAGQVAVDPVADGPVEVRGEVDAAGRRAAVGRRDEHGRADVVERLGLQDADRRDPAAVRGDRRAGRRSRPARGPRAARRSRRRRARRRPPPRSSSAARRSGCGPRSLVKTTVRPSGCQAMSLTPQSPLVTCRGTAPRSRSTTHRCDQRSRWPSSSQRQSMRSIRRARGLSLLGRSRRGRPCPTSQRGGSTSAVNARRRPVRRPGDLADPAVAAAPDACAPGRRRCRSAAGSRARRRRRGRSGRRRRVRPSGEIRGRVSRTTPLVRTRGRAIAAPPTAERHGQQGPVVADPVDRPPDHDGQSSRRATGRAPRRRPGAGCRPGSSEAVGSVGHGSGQGSGSASGPACPVATCPTSWDGRVATLDRDVQGPPRHRTRRSPRRWPTASGVVALESTLISHGLPYPANLEVALASEAAVRESGAIPATVAVMNGRVLVGMTSSELEAFATAPAGIGPEGVAADPRRGPGLPGGSRPRRSPRR